MRCALAVLAGTVVVACGSVSPVSSVASPSPPAVAYVPWVALPEGHEILQGPPQGTPLPVPNGTPLCSVSQLEGRLVGRYSAMSNLDVPIVLRNTGATTCHLIGFPDVTIVDSAGKVMGSIAGPSGAGTYFDLNVSPVDVLMEPHPASLAGEADWNDGQGLDLGQAFINLEWAGCTTQHASAVYIHPPNSAGRVRVPFDVAPNGPDVCSRTWPVTRGPFDPTGISWPPDRHLLKIGFSISTPYRSVPRGTTLEYFVTVLNQSREVYTLTRCPDYFETVTSLKGASYTYQLNCASTGAVQPGASVTFQMKLLIPATAPTGSTTLLWGLFDGRITPLSDAVDAPITIT